jgi:iron complex outermembrane receptor protein
MRFLSTLIYLFICVSCFSQYTLSGVVVNSEGERLESAVVYIEGTNHLTSTDNKGMYTLNGIPSGTYNLMVTYLGYEKNKSKIVITSNMSYDIAMAGNLYKLNEVEIQANRVGSNGPFTNKNLQKDKIQSENLGQDAPYIMQWTPSMVVSSDAGNGIGYTNLRMRGNDQTRINVTLNGAPVNDAESHNVFWVDLPNLMASTRDIQIQRGVGTSTNGAGAFGGTISINTSDIKVNPFIDADATIGAFGTQKLSIGLGTGLMNNKYSIEGRYSNILSDGYVDRAQSRLNSFYITAARVTDKSSLRFNVLNGQEITYQAWNGTPGAKLGIGNDNLIDHYNRNIGSIYKNAQDSINLFASDRSYNYYTYQNQIDDYGQTYLQLIQSNQWNDNFSTKALVYYTRGAGYFEEFKYQDALSKYYPNPVLSPSLDTIFNADVTRQRWLSNDLFGANFDLVYKQNKSLEWQFGMAANIYFGRHFGKVIDLGFPVQIIDYIDDEYYRNKGEKSDVSSYLRAIYKIGNWEGHADFQVRNVDYKILGTDNDNRNLDIKQNYTFLNPKLGVSYIFNNRQYAYASYALASKEPIRSDFIDNAFGVIPQAEKLNNLELGYQYSSPRLTLQSNIYFMNYRDQLVLTGNLNDVGAPIRINVPKSHRLGWEVDAAYSFANFFEVAGNLTLSKNKINDFTETIYDYTNGFEEKLIQHGKTDISFSPSAISTLQIVYKPFKVLRLTLSNKYVSKQFLDNTSSNDRIIPAFDYQNMLCEFSPTIKKIKNLKLSLMVNNVFNRNYVSNGYTYSYIFQETVTENFYYPQAGRHLMLNVRVGL